MALSIIVVGLACVGCTSARLKRRVAIVENRATEVEQNLAKLRQLPADVAASRAYVKDVSDEMKDMRREMVGMLDEQNLKVEQGRREYVRVLTYQKMALSALQVELDKLIEKVEGQLPQATKGATASAPGTTPWAGKAAP
jgi:hypothetical protein